MDIKTEALQKLQTEKTDEALWACIELFQNEEICMFSGVTFTYTLKYGKNGEYTKELWVDRRKNSKSLAFGSVLRAFHNLLALGDVPLVDRPKALGDIRGVSYSYALFAHFGLLRMPEKEREEDSAGQVSLWG